MLARLWRKGNPSTVWVGMQTGATIVEFLKSLKIELPSDPVIPLLGLYPKNPETPIQKNLCAQMLTAALFYHSQVLETAQVPISR